MDVKNEAIIIAEDIVIKPFALTPPANSVLSDKVLVQLDALTVQEIISGDRQLSNFRHWLVNLYNSFSKQTLAKNSTPPLPSKLMYNYNKHSAPEDKKAREGIVKHTTNPSGRVRHKGGLS